MLAASNLGLIAFIVVLGNAFVWSMMLKQTNARITALEAKVAELRAGKK